MSQAWLEGELIRVSWFSESTGWAVVRIFSVDRLEETAVGPLAVLAEAAPGSFVALEGAWESHPTHGRQFKVSGFLQGTPRSLEGMRLYLASHGVKGVGPQLANKIVAHFGVHTPAVIANEPQRLIEVAGIGHRKANAIAEAWSRDEEGRALQMMLRGHGMPARLVEAVRKRYGDKAIHVVRSEPYRLAEEIRGIGFKTADAIAQHQGLAPDAPARVRAAVGHVVDRDAGDGHCFLPRRQVRRAVAALGVPVGALDEAVESAASAGRVVVEPAPDPEDDRVWGTDLYDAEIRVANDLARRARATGVAPADSEIARAEKYEGVQLHPEQRAAVSAAFGGEVVVVTGGPGTGKTTLLRVLLRVARERGKEFQVASPTGRAARRLEEATGQSASTLHRLLEYRPGEGGFQRNFSNPLEGDGIVIDEVSMVDLALMAALLDAAPEGAPLIFVGDADQLPSVGPGQILRDLIASKAVPVARLSTIHRQAADSGIIAAATTVRAGQVPASGESTGKKDCFLLQREDVNAARATLLKVVADRLPAQGFDAVSQVQVLAPTRRGGLGTELLNRELQQRLNPGEAALKRGEVEFRVGDRVLCTRNRYDVEVFNGDVGRIKGAHGGQLDIDFDGRSVQWGRDDLNTLDLAYAITVHKSQGSEYPAVVLAMHPSHGIMLRRNLFYTALTRASRFVCVIGSQRGWARAVGRTGGDERYTGLAGRLRDCMNAPQQQF